MTEKKNNIVKVFRFFTFFLILTALIIGWVNLSKAATIKYVGMTTEEQIKTSFHQALSDDYDCYIIGGSKLYRGINPDYLSESSYNFSHDNDNYNQTYYKLLYLDKNGVTMDTLIIDTEYFKFSSMSDTRNYVYNDLLGDDYTADYSDEAEDVSEPIIEQVENISKKVNDDIINVFQKRYDYVHKYLRSQKAQNVNYLKSNGQYIVYGAASPDDTIKRNTGFLDIQVAYFEKIIEFCKENNINLYIVMLPVRESELSNYTDAYIEEFNTFIRSEIEGTSFRYLNFSKLEYYQDYKKYVDICHFKQDTADEFTQFLNEDIFDS